MLRTAGCLLFLIAILAAGFFFGRDYVRRHPQDFPWTELELGHPIGRFTSGKIASLGDARAQCRALLENAGLGDAVAPDRLAPDGCGYEDGMQLAGAEGGRSLDYRPAGLITSCPVAAGLHLWETRVVQPAAERHFGAPVTRIAHAGSYSCRRRYGREEGELSEHASADALDVTGFRLANGEDVSVLNDWQESAAKAEFLRDVRDGACGIFSTVLSPEYNEAHRDHLHLDVANRGGGPWTLCR